MFKKIVIKLIDLYKKTLSPLTGYSCRFYPTCSEYTKQAVNKYGVLMGLYLGFKRIMKCNIWNGGVDELK